MRIDVNRGVKLYIKISTCTKRIACPKLHIQFPPSSSKSLNADCKYRTIINHVIIVDGMEKWYNKLITK